ncbi:hypothetical protein Pan44_20370 [Caulifigura coniformis]|uniref:Uncharacterized protein n=1 Tax=Caulifigura coniformis TaxID=2527983 RepID=A0A517SD00_9PLAN|nr:hypothetical protein Pan44_20370 [Caulifigura coniformis]
MMSRPRGLLTAIVVSGASLQAAGCGGVTNENVPTRVVTEDELPKAGELPPPPSAPAPRPKRKQ